MKPDTALSPSRSKSLLTVLCISISAWMLTGCGHLTTKSPAPQIPANLASSCPNLEPIPGMTGRVIVPWIAEVVKQYQDCQDKVQGLQEAWPK